MSVYKYDIQKKDGTTQSLNDFAGKVILIVNSATHCGFTPQYNDLKQLHEQFSSNGFVILDFPCNQFGEQAKGTNDEIAEFCTLNFNTPYELCAKIDVNGENQSELFKYLKEQKGFEGFNNENHPLNERLKEMFLSQDPNYAQSDEIKWNFTKFLIDRNGVVIKRFEPVDDFSVLECAIKEII